MNEQKRNFIEKELAPGLRTLHPSAKGVFGVMNAQQMVEHLSDYVRIASGKVPVKALYDDEVTKKMYAFMMSEKPFRDNTPNQLLPDVPPAWRNPSMDAAVDELEKEIADFFKVYAASPGLRVQSPFFGQLNAEEQVQLLHKHAVHHCRQFGLL
jgi:hypothetical protein